MNHSYRASLTPSVARRIVQMSQVNNRIDIDPVIREIAKQGLVAPGDLDALALSDDGRIAVQQLLDLDLRAAVALPNNGPHRVNWLRPVLAAIKLRGGVTDIVVGGDTQPIDIGWEVETMLPGVRVYEFDYFEERVKNRDAAVYLHTNMTGFIGGLPDSALIFSKTIYVGLQRLTSGLQMYPNMPSLTSVLGKNSNKLYARGFKTSARQIGFVFNVVNALNREPE
jgi:hypothetical protein